jgi:hypothetical protein
MPGTNEEKVCLTIQATPSEEGDWTRTNDRFNDEILLFTMAFRGARGA